MGCLKEFGIQRKILAIVTDNASNNSSFLSHFENECVRNGMHFDKLEHHVRCADHILNLAVQAFLKELKADFLFTTLFSTLWKTYPRSNTAMH